LGVGILGAGIPGTAGVPGAGAPEAAGAPEVFDAPPAVELWAFITAGVTARKRKITPV